MRPGPQQHEVDGVKAVCAPPALYILTTPGSNRRPRSCLKPALATCKWSAMRCEISTGRPDASFRPFPFAVWRLVSLQLYLCVDVKGKEVGKRTSVCVCQQMPAVWTLEYRRFAFPVPLSAWWTELRLTEPSWSELLSLPFCAVLSLSSPGLAVQVLQNGSN